jgi:hypothetical protein
VRQISREALGEGVPAWADKMLGQLNRFMNQVTDALTSNLDSRNLASSYVDLAVTEGVSVNPFVAKLGGRKAHSVQVAKVTPLGTGGTPGTAPTGAVTVLWDVATVDGQPGVSISTITGLATGARYTLRLRLEAE